MYVHFSVIITILNYVLKVSVMDVFKSSVIDVFKCVLILAWDIRL